MIRAGASPESRIEHAYRLILTRRPSVAERSVLLASLARVLREFAADPKAAAAFLTSGESPRDSRIDPVEHAAYAALAQAVMNLDEALCKE